MGAPLLTQASTLQCPHGGTVTIAGAQPRARAGAPVCSPAASFTIVGCPFQIPAVVPIPSPCVTVLWLKTDARVKLGGVPSLSAASAGLCIGATGAPQGPVVVVAAQPRAASV